MRLCCERHEWGFEVTGFGRPFGLCVSENNDLFVTDMDCHSVIRIKKDFGSFSLLSDLSGWTASLPLLEGRSLYRPTARANAFNGPHSVTFDGENRLIVTSYYRPSVDMIHMNGCLENIVGKDFLTGPATTASSQSGNLIVSEYSKNLVMLFTTDGKYIGRIGRGDTEGPLWFDHRSTAVKSSALPGGLDRPHMAVELNDGSLLVADTWNNRLQKFNTSNKTTSIWNGISGWVEYSSNSVVEANGLLSCPVSIDEKGGSILVTEWGSGKLLLIGPDGDGRYLMGCPPLNKPYDARFYGDGIVVTDSHNGRVLILS